MSKKRHKLVALGGTFDHLHDGHKALIQFASQWGEKLLIGVCDDVLARSKILPKTIQPLIPRKRAVGNFCTENHIPVELITLHDPLGPTVEEGNKIDALVVSSETVKGGNKINEIREKLGMRSLPVYICPLVNDLQGEPIHSDRVRQGFISRSGVVYGSVLNQTVVISSKQREAIQNLKYNLVEKPTVTIPSAPITAAVGDVTLAKFIQNRWPFQIGIFDNLVERHEKHLISGHQTHDIDNPAGQITLELSQKLTEIVAGQLAKAKNLDFIQVKGEEDLASVALVLLLPLYSHIYFGLPGKGLVEMIVTETLKDKLYNLLVADE